jgi:hypothetical protein
MNPMTEEMAVSTETPTWEELRARPRYSVDSSESIRVRIESNGNPPVVAVLVDESSDGIGVLCCEHAGFQIGEVVQVLYRCARLTATVKYQCFTDQSQSQSRVGLVWQTSLNHG